MSVEKIKISQKEPFQKWPLTALIAFVAIISIIASLCTPLSMSIIRKTMTMYKNHRMLSSLDNFDEEIKKLNLENAKLDSMIVRYQKKHDAEKISLVEALYSCADRAGMKTSKVETGEPVHVDNHYESSIQMLGSGSFEVIGKFTESIENADEPVRIRSIKIDSEKGDLLEMSMDFVITE